MRFKSFLIQFHQVCEPVVAKHVHKTASLSLKADIGFVSYELSLNDTTNVDKVNVAVAKGKHYCAIIDTKFIG